MNPQEINIEGHIVTIFTEDNCEFCEQEMQNIMMYGVVCTNPDCKVNKENE